MSGSGFLRIPFLLNHECGGKCEPEMCEVSNLIFMEGKNEGIAEGMAKGKAAGLPDLLQACGQYFVLFDEAAELYDGKSP